MRRCQQFLRKCPFLLYDALASERMASSARVHRARKPFNISASLVLSLLTDPFCASGDPCMQSPSADFSRLYIIILTYKQIDEQKERIRQHLWILKTPRNYSRLVCFKQTVEFNDSYEWPLERLYNHEVLTSTNDTWALSILLNGDHQWKLSGAETLLVATKAVNTGAQIITSQ